MPIYIILLIIALILLASIRQVNQYERGVKFTIGNLAESWSRDGG
ncbi:MAG: hypothetical protein UU98_C0007G0046 [Parcubacteria group bacterium GW2011_GWD2_42_14]|nr:MAG: hypothetical protein UU98_C0007G0046 [Parcubacteria group bacterium GW2011_GWD2_42_14]